MLTLGTGFDPEISWRGVNLLPSHSYAVIGDIQALFVSASGVHILLDVKEDASSRGFTVLDSWIHTSDEPTADTDGVPSWFNFISSRKLLMIVATGVLDIPWSDVLEVFDSVYLSWDPRIWAKNLIFHG